MRIASAIQHCFVYIDAVMHIGGELNLLALFHACQWSYTSFANRTRMSTLRGFKHANMVMHIIRELNLSACAVSSMSIAMHIVRKRIPISAASQRISQRGVLRADVLAVLRAVAGDELICEELRRDALNQLPRARVQQRHVRVEP